VTDDASDARPVSFLGKGLPPWAQVRFLTIAPGESVFHDEPSWGDALVVVERGRVALESHSGRCRVFECGDVLWLAGVPLRAIRNVGDEPALLSAVSRRPPASSG
jgi:hypothetical protein